MLAVSEPARASVEVESSTVVEELVEERRGRRASLVSLVVSLVAGDDGAGVGGVELVDGFEGGGSVEDVEGL